MTTVGWNRVSNTGEGHFNNDLYFTDNVGDCWKVDFNGKAITIIAPVGPDYGKMRILIDGQDCGTVDLSATKAAVQQSVFRHRCHKRGKHSIEVICLSGTAAVDALIIESQPSRR